MTAQIPILFKINQGLISLTTLHLGNEIVCLFKWALLVDISKTSEQVCKKFNFGLESLVDARVLPDATELLVYGPHLVAEHLVGTNVRDNREFLVLKLGHDVFLLGHPDRVPNVGVTTVSQAD